MRSYLNFKLTGSHLLPVYIAFFLFFMIPYYFLLGEFAALTSTHVAAGGPSKLFFLYFIFVLLMGFTFIFCLSKMVIQSVSYQNKRFICDYHIGEFAWIVLSGIIFSFFTFGIYFPWFIRNINRFFVNGTLYNTHRFSFGGDGLKLFFVMTLTIITPFFLVGILLFSIFASKIDFQSQNFLLIYQLIVMFSLVPNIFLTYKWMVNIQYKAYSFKLESDFFSATAKIGLELLLAVVTLGIYFPMTYLRLYRYFVEHTSSNVVDGIRIRLGYDGDLLHDFFYLWGQILISVLTLGFYFPWAFSRIANRVFTQTYVNRESVA